MRNRILAHIIKVIGGKRGPHWGGEKICIIKIFKATGQDDSNLLIRSHFYEMLLCGFIKYDCYFNSGFDFTSTVITMKHPRRKGY